MCRCGRAGLFAIYRDILLPFVGWLREVYSVKFAMLFSMCFVVWSLPLDSRADQAAVDGPGGLMAAPKPGRAPKIKKVTTCFLEGKIVNFNETTLVLKVEGALANHQCVLTPQTQYIAKGAKPASYKNLRKNKRVGVLLQHTPAGTDVALQVDFSVKKEQKKKSSKWSKSKSPKGSKSSKSSKISNTTSPPKRRSK